MRKGAGVGGLFCKGVGALVGVCPGCGWTRFKKIKNGTKTDIEQGRGQANNTGYVPTNKQGFTPAQDDRIRSIEFQLTTLTEAFQNDHNAYVLGETYDSFRQALTCNYNRIEQVLRMLQEIQLKVEQLELLQMKSGSKRKRE